MSEQKISRREKHQKAKRKKQMQSIGIMILGVLIIVSGIVLVAMTKPKVTEAPQVTYQNVNGNAIGNPDAPVVMEEYFSFGCSHCANYAADGFPPLLEEYINTGKVYFISRPFTNPTDVYGIAAQAALCASDQGKYFEMYDAIFANFSAYGYQGNELESMADSIGLNLDDYKACMSSGKHISTIDEFNAQATEAGITSTPNFLVNGELAIVGNREYSIFQETINQAIAAQSGN